MSAQPNELISNLHGRGLRGWHSLPSSECEPGVPNPSPLFRLGVACSRGYPGEDVTPESPIPPSAQVPPIDFDIRSLRYTSKRRRLSGSFVAASE